MTHDKTLDSLLRMDYMGGIRSNILTGKERQPKGDSTMNETTTKTAKPRSDAPVPAFKVFDDFDMPTSAPKYPWRGLKVNQVVAFPGVNSDEAERLIRSATSTGRHYGLKFATKRLPKSEQFPDGALAIKLTAITEPKKAKKKAKAAPTTQAATPQEEGVLSTGEPQQQKIA